MNKSSPIRIVIVDDHAMTRAGLRFFLKAYDDLQLVGEASSGTEVLALCQQAQPDVILMDMVIPDLDGAQTTQRIRRQYPHIQVLALTSFEQDELVQKALQSGAIGYLLKNVSAQKLVEAIRAAHAGRSTLAQEVANAVVSMAHQSPPEPGHDLTPREREVLALLVEGLSNAQIAERLTISPATVKYHVRGVLNKLGATSRTEAVSLAWQHNLTT